MKNPKVKRDPKTGRWKESGNPTGNVGEVKALARVYTKEALETLKCIMMNNRATHSARVTAANSILDRAWGKAEQHTSLEVKNDIAAFLAGLGSAETDDAPVESEAEPVRH